MATNQLGFTGTPPNASINTSGNDWGFKYSAVATGYTLVAPENGTCSKLFVYKSDTEIDMELAVYDSSNNQLTTVQVQNDNGIEGWLEVTCPSFSVVAGNSYYPALLTNGPLLQILWYDTTTGNESARIADITPLPDPWTEPQNRTYVPAVYMEYDGAATGITGNDLVLSSHVLSSPAVSGIATITGDILTIPPMGLSEPTATALISGETLVLSQYLLEEPVIYAPNISPNDLTLSEYNLSIPVVSEVGEIVGETLVLGEYLLSESEVSEVGPITGDVLDLGRYLLSTPSVSDSTFSILPDIIVVSGEITTTMTVNGDLS